MINANFKVVCLTIAIAGCASPTRVLVQKVELGMTTDAVAELLGEPSRKETEAPFVAWRYEYTIVGPTNCEVPPSGNSPYCRQLCEHATVWFNDGAVRSMTSVVTDGVNDCGSGSAPVVWQQMPAYAANSED